MKTKNNGIRLGLLVTVVIIAAISIFVWQHKANATATAGHLRVYTPKNFNVTYTGITDKEHAGASGNGHWKKSGDVVAYANTKLAGNENKAVNMKFTVHFVITNNITKSEIKCDVPVICKSWGYKITDCNVDKKKLTVRSDELTTKIGQDSTRYATITFLAPTSPKNNVK